jgi:hypothetical protein
MLRRALLLLGLLMGPQIAAAQAPVPDTIRLRSFERSAVDQTTVAEISDDAETLQITSGGTVVTRRQRAGEVSFQLVNVEDGSSETLPFRTLATPARAPQYELRVNERYVAFTEIATSQFSVYDRRTGQVRRFTHPEGGRVTDVSVHTETGDVLYEVSLDGPVPRRVYLWNEGASSPERMGALMRPRWSPGGRVFLALKKMSASEAATEEDGWYWWLYDREGNPLVGMSEYGLGGYVSWSPDSKKLALESIGSPVGFFLVYLSEDSASGEGSQASVRIDQARYIAPPEGQAYTHAKWSPDGSRLAFAVWFGDDETGDQVRLRILKDEPCQIFSAGRAPSIGSNPWTWSSPESLYVVGDFDTFRPARRGTLNRVSIQF